MLQFRTLALALAVSPLALAAQGPPTDFLSLREWNEPASCTRATCALRVERLEDGEWLVRGEPGSRVGRAEWLRRGLWDRALGEDYEVTFRALAVAVASNPNAVSLVKAAHSASRTRALSEAIGVASLGVGLLVGATTSGNTSDAVSVGLQLTAGVSTLPDIISHERMLRRITEALRVYNAGLPESAVGAASPGATSHVAAGAPPR